MYIENTRYLIYKTWTVLEKYKVFFFFPGTHPSPLKNFGTEVYFIIQFPLSIAPAIDNTAFEMIRP
jgi:hypothetical protein